MEPKVNLKKFLLRSLSYVLVAVLASVFVLGEAISLPQIIGGVLILGFTLWNELGKSK